MIAEQPTDIVIGVGLFCFGVFSLMEARYRRLPDMAVDNLTLPAT